MANPAAALCLLRAALFSLPLSAFSFPWGLPLARSASPPVARGRWSPRDGIVQGPRPRVDPTRGAATLRRMIAPLTRRRLLQAGLAAAAALLSW